MIFLFPGCRLNPCLSAMKLGGSCNMEGARAFLPGASGMVAVVEEDHTGVSGRVVLLFLMRCTAFHGPSLPSCLWVVFEDDSAAACCLLLLPRGGRLGT